jgi:aldehyde:ferredoxin oxidoreductase
LLVFNRLHTLPTRNFQQSTFAGAADLAPETLQQTREKTRASCRACTIGCEHLYQLTDSTTKVRLEYENLFALGPLCGISDSETVLRASHRCDEIGIDTISAGGTIAFAMECVQRGLLVEPWLKFGDPDALLRAIELIGRREGIGDQLANGSRALATTLGANSIRFAAQVKGMELPGYEPRTLQTMALGFAVGTRGADHNRSSAYEVDFSEKVDRRQVSNDAVMLAIEAEDRATLLDSLILCKFLRGVFTDIWVDSAEMLRMVTGWDVDGDELRQTSRRIVSAKKQFNILAGWRPAEDTLPDRFFDDPLPDDPARLSRERLSELVQRYNLQRGWHADGYLPGDNVSGG